MLPKFIYQLTCLTFLIISLLTLLSLFGRYPFLELSTHFRLQYFGVSLICLISLCAFHSWKFALLALFCAVFNGFYILPYYFSDKHQAKDVPTVKVRLVLANIEARNKDRESLIESINSANPDILVLQEVTEGWWKKIQDLTDVYPHFKALPLSGGGGLALLSRFPIEQVDVLQLDSSPHPAILSKINLDGTILTLLTIHPPTPMRSDKFANRNKQFTESASIMESAPNPKVLIGDLNTTIWSPYFTDLVADSGLRDVRKGRGIYPSWNTLLPNFMRIPIDHCLIGEGIEVENVELGDYTGSDHFPLIVDLKIEKN